MYRNLFNLVGAFALWTLSGFKGKYENHLDDIGRYNTSIIGGFTIFFLLMIIALTIKFIQN
jgi:hypothetical protein